MNAAIYKMDEGVKQGDMEAMPNFCGINQANKSTHDSLQEKGGIILSGADDTYILGPPEIAFPEVKRHEERLASIGLKLNNRKRNVISRSLRNSKCIMSYERQRISQKDLQKVKMGRGYLAFVPMEFQSEVKSLSRDD